MARTSKPNCISITPAPLRMAVRSWMSYGFAVGFDLLKPQVLIAEADVWQSIPQELSHIGAIDLGLAKGEGEWLLAGRTFAPGDQPLKSWDAQVKLAQHNKVVRVHGARAWDGRNLSAAQPCTEVQMDWAAAYGGAEFAENTKGCGLKQTNGDVTVPSIERPGSPWQNPDKAIATACTLPVDVLHPARQRYMGTYGVDYLEKYFPGMPPDFDRRYFNLAPQDQRIAGPWRGDEAYELRNWHAQHPIIQGTLPQLRAALWLGLGDKPLQKVETQLSTVWFFPNALMGVLVFHGLCPVDSIDGHDVTRILAGVEHLNDIPRSKEHYESTWHQRTERTAEAAAQALNDAMLCPPGYTTRFAAVEAGLAGYRPSPILARQSEVMARQFTKAAESVEASIAKVSDRQEQDTIMKLRELATRFRDYATTSQAMARKLPTLDELPAYLESTRQLMQQLESDAESEMAKHPPPKDETGSEALQNLKKQAAERGITAPNRSLDALREMAQKMPENPTGDNEISRAQALASVQKLEQQLSRHGKTPEDAMVNIEKMAKAYQGGLPNQPEMRSYADAKARQQSWKDNPTLPSFQEIDQSTLSEPEPPWATQASVSNREYASLCLTSMDLQGITLEKVTLVSCDLRKACFVNAKFIDCTFVGCDFTETEAATIDIQQCDFRWCRLEGLQSPSSKWNHCSFTNCNAQRANFDHSTWLFCQWIKGDHNQSSWRASKFLHYTAHEIDFGISEFDAVNAEKSSWSECKLKGCNWSSVKLTRCTYPMSELPLQWKSASLSNVCLHGAKSESSQWHDAILDSVDFGEANLRGASFTRVQAKNLQMQHADLQNCDFSGAVIENGIFVEADLRACLFSNAKLSHCIFSRIVQNNQTSFVNTDLSSSTLLPKREEHFA